MFGYDFFILIFLFTLKKNFVIFSSLSLLWFFVVFVGLRLDKSIVFHTMLSCFEDIIAIPCGTLLASATGVITKVMESEKKVSVVLVCGSGENFVVTEFKQNSANALQKYLSVGNVLKLQSVKAQRFNEKFDGQKFFQTPFPFEFVVTKHSKICLVKTEVLVAEKFTQLVAGRFYKIKCVLTTPFSLIGEMFAAVVGDFCGKRADLFISGEKLPEMFGQLDSKDQLELKRCFVKIEDECMQLNVLASDVNVCGCKVTIGDKLVTPVKRKSVECRRFESIVWNAGDLSPSD